MEYTSEPDNLYEESFVVRTYETSINNRVTLPSYCNFLQESAAKHTRELSRTTHKLDSIGHTWILSRLHLVVNSYVRWRDEVKVQTWLSGIRDRTTALRDFIIEDQWDNPILQCVSEWFYVETSRMQISPLPAYCNSISPNSVSRAEVPETSGRIPEFSHPLWQSSFDVRKSDHDFNQHVNNSHYIEWLFEALPKEWQSQREVTELDINFKAGARQGDTLITEVVQEMDNVLLHRIRRNFDDAILVTARTRWKEN